MDVKGTREILFRGKWLSNGEWVYGFIAKMFGTYYIIDKDDDKNTAYEVIPETVAQYTGLTDKNGKKIFEGDILRHYNHSVDTEKYEVGEVFFDSYSACFKRTSNPGAVYLGRRCTYEVIGNVHDNPELLKGSNEEV